MQTYSDKEAICEKNLEAEVFNDRGRKEGGRGAAKGARGGEQEAAEA